MISVEDTLRYRMSNTCVGKLRPVDSDIVGYRSGLKLRKLYRN